MTQGLEFRAAEPGIKYLEPLSKGLDPTRVEARISTGITVLVSLHIFRYWKKRQSWTGNSFHGFTGTVYYRYYLGLRGCNFGYYSDFDVCAVTDPANVAGCTTQNSSLFGSGLWVLSLTCGV